MRLSNEASSRLDDVSTGEGGRSIGSLSINQPLSSTEVICENDDEASIAEGHRVINRFQKYWSISLFSLATILLYSDQNLIAPNLSAIAKEFVFNDEQRDMKLGGDISLAFFLLGAPAAVLMGYLADRYNRSVLLAIAVATGEAGCLGVYFTSSYRALYYCRAITGFGLGGSVPIIYSILGDLFEAHERPAASAGVSAGTGVGVASGQGIAGFLGPTYGWRLPFLLVSVPALLCAATVLFTVKDPERGSMEKAVMVQRKRHGTSDQIVLAEEYGLSGSEQSDRDSSSEQISGVNLIKRRNLPAENETSIEIQSDSRPPKAWCSGRKCCEEALTAQFGAFASLFSYPTVVLLILQGLPGCIPWGVVNTYLSDYLSTNRGLSVEGATTVFLTFGVGFFNGLIIGGAAGNYLYRLNPQFPVLLGGSSAVLCCIPVWILLDTVDANETIIWICFIALVAGISSGIPTPIVKATMQNVTLPTTRGQAFALLNIFDEFGPGLGPAFVARLIVNIGGRQQAFNVAICGWVICGLLQMLMFFTSVKDEQRVQQTLADSLGPPTENDDAVPLLT